jgi:hypothetical protein
MQSEVWTSVGVKMATIKVTLKRHPTIKNLWATKEGRVFIESLPQLGSKYVMVNVPGGVGGGLGRMRRPTVVLEIWKGLRPKGLVGRQEQREVRKTHRRS